MRTGDWSALIWGAVLFAIAAALPTRAVTQQGLLFQDDFEAGLGQWTFPVGMGARLVPSGDEHHGMVLQLQTENRIVVALMSGSDSWPDVRIEGEVLFPEDVHNYLGFVYRYQEGDGRTDFGSLYIKGNGSYIRVNPHYDLNVGRTFHEEFRTPLTGPAAITVGEWSSFALEVVGGEAHLYVGDMGRPQITFPAGAGSEGAFGFKPRNPGGAVWVDALRVTAIDGFSYQGEPIPSFSGPEPPMQLTWQALGPLTEFQPGVETSPYDADLVIEDAGREVRWMPFAPDRRGAVVTGRVTEYGGPRKVAYFRATVHSDAAQDVTLSLSSVDNLSLWLNGRFLGFLPRAGLAWWDAWFNEAHAADRGRLRLQPGENELLVRVVGGTYATGAFFLRLVPNP